MKDSKSTCIHLPMAVAEQKQASVRETLYGVAFVMGILRMFLNVLTFFTNSVMKAYSRASVFPNTNL